MAPAAALIFESAADDSLGDGVDARDGDSSAQNMQKQVKSGPFRSF